MKPRIKRRGWLAIGIVAIIVAVAGTVALELRLRGVDTVPAFPDRHIAPEEGTTIGRDP